MRGVLLLVPFGMNKLWHREMKYVSQGYTTRKPGSSDLSPGSLALEASLSHHENLKI